MANACNALEAVAFVKKFKADCLPIAQQLAVPVEYILGLAAEESLYGKGRIASEYNNYFSLHAPAPFETREESARADPKVKVAVFDSFTQSARSFAAKYGSYVKNANTPEAFADALVSSHFNSGDASNGGRSGFKTYLVGIIAQVKARMEC